MSQNEAPSVPQPVQTPPQPMYQLPPQPMYPPPLQPMYPPPQKPPHSRGNPWLILGGVLLALLIIGAIVSQISPPSASAPSPQATQSSQQGGTQPYQPTATQPSQPTATQAPQANTIGKPVQVGDTWVVTVNSVKTHGAGEFSHPKSGDTYLVVDVTLKNISSSVQNAYSSLFDLKDQTGQRYSDTYVDFAKDSPDGKVSAGGLVRGEMVYEVPASMHTFTLSFSPWFIGNDMAEWNVKV